nr:hypothetical protein [Tanacetum cinerariifolium]
MTESPLVESGFAVPVFSLGDDPIACLNKAMDFLTAITSSSTATSSGGNNASRHARVVKCYNCQAEAQEAGQILDEEQLVFLADPGVPNGQAVQTLIPNNADFQTEDLDTYDSDCDDISNAKAVLMANISNYGSDVISEKAQRIKPTLYDGIVISNKHIAMAVIDDEETLILKEVSRSKMSKKDKDPEASKQKISNKPIDYVKLNKLYEDFGKRFVPQQELSADEALWYHMVNPSTKSSNALPIKIEAPKELSKVSLVNESLKKLKLHLANFDKVVKIKTTPNARTEEVQTVFDQMDSAVQQSSVDKQCLENAKKDLFLENDRLLHQIMSQDVLLTMRNSMSLIDESACFNLEVELLKSQNAHNDLLKRCSQLEKDCISLESSIQLNQEIFQKDESCDNQNALKILEYFQNNDLKAQLQDKDTII